MSPSLFEDGVWVSVSYFCRLGLISERKGTERALLQHLMIRV